eukprot:PITA_06977
MRTLQLTNLQHTTIVLELADRSKVIPEGILENIIVSLDSWEYPVDFLVLQPKSNLGGHPIILGRPWLATADAFIGCQSGNMIISRGTERKQLTLYPSTQSPAVTHNLWLDDKFNDKNEVQPLFSIDQIYNFQEHDNNDLVELFLAQPDISENLRHDQYYAADILLAQNFQETCTIHSLQTTFHDIFPVQSITNTQSKVIEISPGKTLNIGNHLDSSQQERLIQLLRKYQKAFAWDYTDMHGIHPDTCTHHIYTDNTIKPVRQPQRRMNPVLQDIVREELQKLLRVNFIYPISDSQWVSPLVVVPKKNVYDNSFDHALENLERVLKRCIEFNLSLSNEKCFMMLNEGIVLGHYISSQGITVDPAKIQIIVDLPIPQNQREKLSTAPILRGPNWNLPFHIFTDASDTAVGASLGQKEESCTYAIYFISKNLTPAELNYTVTEKETLAIIYAVNKFRHYITGYEVFVHTDHSAIKHLMNKPITSGRVTRWLLLLQEFNITVLDRPGKENQVANFLSRLQNQGEVVPVEDSFPDEHLFSISIVNPWYADLANYLSTGRTPPHFTTKEKKRLVKQSARYSWFNGDLFYTGYDMIIRRCVRNDEVLDILKSCHDEPCGGHFAAKQTTFKVLTLGYYWPSIFKDAKKYVKSCDICQRMGRPTATDEMPLQPQVHLEPFDKWALDFIGPINPSSNGKKYILVCTDYVTKWAEAKALVRATEHTVVNFLFEEIFVRYGVPREIVTDQSTQFTSKLVKDVTDKYKIKHRKSTPYHPQANGQVESTNKTLEGIITKTVAMNGKNWEEKLKDAHWAYRIT